MTRQLDQAEVEPVDEAPSRLPLLARRSVVLGGIALVALVIRMAMVFVVHPLCDFDPDRWSEPSQYVTPTLGTGSCMTLGGDSVYMYLQGRMLANGDGLSDPVAYFTDGTVTPSGKKPPGVAFLVAGLAEAGIGSPDASRAVLALLGTLAVVVIGMAAWDLGGRRAGAIAAGLAAVSPVLVTNDWRMLTEPLLTLAFAGVVLFAYRLWARPSVFHALLFGLCIGAGCYARFESLALLLFVAAPLVFGLRWLRWGNRFQLAVVVAIGAFAVALPLMLYNLARFNNFAPFGPGSGWGLKNATCDDAWYGDNTGYLSFSCFDVATVAEATAVSARRTDPPPDESDTDVVYRRRAWTYIEANTARFPAVAAARVGRVLGLYQPAQTVAFDSNVEQRGDVDSWAALLSLAVILPLSVLGVVVLWHRRVPLSPLLGATALMVCLVVASFGLLRYRVYLDVVALLTAGLGLDALVGRVRRASPDRRWWEPAAGSVDGPSPAVRDGSARATWTRWVPGRPTWIATAAVAVVLALAVGWSATLEPAASSPSSPEGVALCNDLGSFEQLFGQIGAQPEVAPSLLATVDRLAPVAPPDLVQPLAVVRSEVSAFQSSGLSPTAFAGAIGAERQQRLLDAVREVSDARASRC